MKITNTVFNACLKCKYKAWMILQGEHRSPHRYEEIMAESQEKYKLLANMALLNKLKLSSAPTFPKLNKATLTEEHSLILDTVIEHGQLCVHLDALRRVDDKSALGNILYEPVLFHAPDRVRKEQKLCLALAGYAISKVQGAHPVRGVIIYGNNCSMTTVQLMKLNKKFLDVFHLILRMLNREIEPKLLLNRHCDICPFRRRCQEEAVESDSLSRLGGIAERQIEQLNSKGIFTVNQLSYTFRPRRRPKHLREQPVPYSHALKALAIREKKIYIVNHPNIPESKTSIFFDLEGGSYGKSIYLIGALVVNEGTSVFHSFWAGNQTEEHYILEKFLALVDSVDQPHLFCYGSYDVKALRLMNFGRVGNDLQNFVENRSTNILSVIHGNVYFPTYSNSLKDIASFLGCSWSNPIRSGLDALVWRRRWQKNNDDALKNQLLHYNQEDCQALKRVTEFLSVLSDSGNFDNYSVSLVDDLMAKDDLRRWGNRKFAIEAFRIAADSAHFDYQRYRICIRSNSELKAVYRHRQKRRATRNRPNKVVSFQARKCRRCKSTQISKDLDRWHHKLQLDLRISASGIRRCVTEFRTPFHRCLRCHTPFLPPTYKSKRQFGHNLIAWAIYHHISNRMTYGNLEGMLRECFGIHFPSSQASYLKYEAARYYKQTYNKIIRNIVNGRLIHADETKIKLRQETGYVWVFTSLLDAAYVYRPTRRGEFLHEMLNEFGGVLVTDFYSAYDSLKCPQQKCLVHLMWDMNRDLLKNPLDNDLKYIAGEFGGLLREVICTTDRFGLRSRYMRKYKKEVKTFYKKIQEKRLSSRISWHYQDRITKYKHKLFTFLDYDGIPWNNNNAEHAIRPFAKYRRLVKGHINRIGLEKYLILLSIYQTCEYRGVSFLGFLLSKKRDIDQYCQDVWPKQRSGHTHSKN